MIGFKFLAQKLKIQIFFGGKIATKLQLSYFFCTKIPFFNLNFGHRIAKLQLGIIFLARKFKFKLTLDFIKKYFLRPLFGLFEAQAVPDEFLHYNDQRKDFPIIHATYTHQGILSFSSELFLPPRWKKFGSRGSQKKEMLSLFWSQKLFPLQSINGCKLKKQKVWNGFEKFATFLEL